MILLIDNYDSFVHNLGRYVEVLGHATRIVRNDQITLDEIAKLKPEAIILSPGPCGPAQAGICKDLIEKFGATMPILGVCLGHQCIAEVYGCHIVSSHEPMHGKAGAVYHEHTNFFSGVPSPFQAGRYHSLMVKSCNDAPLAVTARAEDNTIMALEHKEYAVYGVQFHPESILTEHGGTLIENFLGLAFKWNEKKKAA